MCAQSWQYALVYVLTLSVSSFLCSCCWALSCLRCTHLAHIMLSVPFVLILGTCTCYLYLVPLLGAYILCKYRTYKSTAMATRFMPISCPKTKEFETKCKPGCAGCCRPEGDGQANLQEPEPGSGHHCCWQCICPVVSLHCQHHLHHCLSFCQAHLLVAHCAACVTAVPPIHHAIVITYC